MSDFIIKEQSGANNPPSSPEESHISSQVSEESQDAHYLDDSRSRGTESSLDLPKEENAQSNNELSPPAMKIMKVSIETSTNGSEHPNDPNDNNHSTKNDETGIKKRRHYKPRVKKDTPKEPKEPKTPKHKKNASKEEEVAAKAHEVHKDVIEDFDRSFKRKNSIYQAGLLEKLFELNSNPSHDIKVAISASSGLKIRQVQVWFQNRRAKLRKDIATLISGKPPDFINTLMSIPDGLPEAPSAPSDVPPLERWSHKPSESEEMLMALLRKSQQDPLKRKEGGGHRNAFEPLFSERSTGPFLSMLSPMPETSLTETSLHILAAGARKDFLLLPCNSVKNEHVESSDAVMQLNNAV